MFTYRMCILVANASAAKLYGVNQLKEKWDLIKEYSHPESRKKNLEIMSDRYGEYRLSVTKIPMTEGHGDFVERQLPKQAEAEKFAEILAKELNLLRSKNLYRELVMVATPHFHGYVNKHLDPHVVELIKKHVPKDYTKLPEQKLFAQLQAILTPPFV